MKSWISQFRKGVLELCILNFVHAQEAHGYLIVKQLQQIHGLDVRESTIYPILARLKTEGYLLIRLEASPAGPARKVFRLSSSGKERLTEVNAYWDGLTESVRTLRKTSIAKGSAS